MNDTRKNISPEIEAAIAEGREIGLREAASYLRGLKQLRVPWILRGLDSAFVSSECDEDGWAEMSDSAKKLLRDSAAGVERLIDGSRAPEHDHAWSSGEDRVCAICGKHEVALVAEAALAA